MVVPHLFISNSERSEIMKKLSFICISIVCIILGINLSIDPGHLLKPDARQSDEARIAGILLANQQAVVPSEKIGFDERVARQMFFEQRSKTDSSVIFGSSRVRYFSKKALNNETHFVDAMNASTLEDLAVLTYLRDKYQQLPKKIYIALDPWMIEQANSYVRLAQISYPDAFVQAVEHFQLSLPAGSTKIYKNLAGNAKSQMRIPMADVINRNQITGDYSEVAIGKLPFGGILQISFDGWIDTGTHNWAWRVLVNGATADEGNYMDNLQGSPSAHESRTVVTSQLEAKAGDVITLEMAHANNEGATVRRAGAQKYNAKNFSVLVKCDNPDAKPFKGWLNCRDFLRPSHYRKYIPIAKEMLSPAYFQQSLKNLFQVNVGSAGSKIEAKQDCLHVAKQSAYIFCSDGSVPWPLVEEYDSPKVENIVRTIDDGLVPLKSIDGNALVLLQQITDFYVSKGATVTYVLIPVHPFSYEKWKSENDSRGFILAESTYRKYASDHQIPIVGSYNPTVIGCKNTDFRDWVHPLPRCTNLIATELQR